MINTYMNPSWFRLPFRTKHPGVLHGSHDSVRDLKSMNTQEMALVSCLTYLFQLTSHLFVCSLNFKAPNLHLHSFPWVYRNPIYSLQTWMSTLGTSCHLTSILRLKMTTGQLSTVNILSICQSTFCNSENLIKKLSESSPLLHQTKTLTTFRSTPIVPTRRFRSEKWSLLSGKGCTKIGKKTQKKPCKS